MQCEIRDARSQKIGAGIKEDEVMFLNEVVVKKSHEHVLERCGGLPLTLAIAEKTIGRICTRIRRRGGEERKCARDAIGEYQRLLENRSKHRKNLVKEAHGDYVGLFIALKTSLELVAKIDEKETRKKVGGR